MRRLRGQSEDTSMKAFTILPAVAAAIMALNISAASSQVACQKEFQACMDKCGSRPTKAMQDTCFTSCEGKNDICAERVYGKRPVNSSPATAAVQQSDVKDALAKDTSPPPAAEPEPAPAPEPRAPARR